jgi:broad specificity phosphatase PhoE
MLRHAPTSWNDLGRRQGRADHPLTPDGRRAAQTWAGRQDVEFAAVVASDLQRAHETAHIIAVALGLGDVVGLVGLREQDQGAWTGLTKEQIRRRWPDLMRERPRRPVDGEAPEDVLVRVLASLGGIAAAYEGRCVLAISHSEVIRTLEHAIGVDAPPVPQLEGRWLRVAATHGPDRDHGVGSVRAGELTAGRRRLRGDASVDLVIAERR